MSTRHHNGSHFENHQQAAELHDEAAHAHRVAAEAHEKQDHQSGHERSRQALEHSQKAHQQTAQTHHVSADGHRIGFGHADIAALAHGHWEARGYPEGSPDEDWFRAAQELRDREESPQK
jgi:hypothetical protein